MARERETPYDGMPTCRPPRVQNHPKGVHRCVLVVPGLPTNEGRQQTENQSVLAGKRMKKGPGVHCSKGIRKVHATPNRGPQLYGVLNTRGINVKINVLRSKVFGGSAYEGNGHCIGQNILK